MRAFAFLAASTLAAVLVGLLAVGPRDGAARTPRRTIESAPGSLDAEAGPPLSMAARIATGRRLVERFECNRCHEGTGLTAPPADKRCVQCHREIADGTRAGLSSELRREWAPVVHDIAYAPSLDEAGKTLAPSFVAAYLVTPFDMRPHLRATMPRLAISKSEASDVALYLASLGGDRPTDPALHERGDSARGRALFAEKRCASCHAFSGAGAPPEPAGERDEKAFALAVDLRFTRQRTTLDTVTAWLDPASATHDTAHRSLSTTDARDLAAFVMTAPLDPWPERDRPSRRLLERPVTFDEVFERVLHRTCWHCHAEPDYAFGDGGPGMTGGFGFQGRHLKLSTYEGVLGGFVDDAGRRRSILEPMDGQEPPLLRALLARVDEERGAPGATRGMPLGMPALADEDIRLVETWIAQGAPR